MTAPKRADGPSGAPPPGFKGAYERAARSPIEPRVLSDLLALVGYHASVEVIDTWSSERRVEAEVYAVNVHGRASDNVLRRHPKPEWLPDPWLGPEWTMGEVSGPGGTPLSAEEKHEP